MKKALIVATVVRFLGFERNDIKILKELGYEVHCATDLTGENERTSDIDMVRHQIDFSRSPFSKRTLIAYKQLKKLLQEENFDLIHCHTPVGGILARLAAKKYRKKGELKVIYTAHGFHFFKGAPIVNWLLYYPAEWICSWMTDVLITINKEDYERALVRFHAKKCVHIPGVGLDIDKIVNKEVNRNKVRKELNINENDNLIISVGELNKNKNHEIVINAISEMTNDTKYIICGEGNRREYLERLIKKNGLDDKVKLLGFRSDIVELCKASDIFAFPSKREGLGLAALEAMAAGLPLVGSNIHGIKDYLIDGVTGYAANPCNKIEFRDALENLIHKEELRKNIGTNNKKYVHKFDISVTQGIMRKVYCEL